MSDETDTPPAFKVGDRVRLRDGVKPLVTWRRGVVLRIAQWPVPRTWDDDGPKLEWLVWIKRDGKKREQDKTFLARHLIPEDDPEVLRDHTADQLIAAYKAGDKTALRPLVDRLLELL